MGNEWVERRGPLAHRPGSKGMGPGAMTEDEKALTREIAERATRLRDESDDLSVREAVEIAAFQLRGA